LSGESSYNPCVPPAKRKNLSEIVTEKIKDLIIRRNLRPGDRLPTEHQLARRFKVSRICVREATKALGFLGIIHGRPRHGLVVGRVDLNRVAQYLGFHLALSDYPKIKLIDARIVIETGALPYTLSRMDAEPGLYEDLRAKADLLEKTTDPGLMVKRDAAFHRALLEASGIEPLVVFNNLLEIFFERFRESLLLGRWKAGKLTHRKILDALRAGRCARAQEMLRTHISYHRKHL